MNKSFITLEEYAALSSLKKRSHINGMLGELLEDIHDLQRTQSANPDPSLDARAWQLEEALRELFFRWYDPECAGIKVVALPKRKRSLEKQIQDLCDLHSNEGNVPVEVVSFEKRKSPFLYEDVTR